MDNNDNYGLEEVHKLLLENLLKFDEICRDNDISYSLHGGTLLGAERNHGFIPWDDDADVSMRRSDYFKFQKITKELTGEYELNETSMWVPRFAMKKDKSIVCIDIFIWDYISEKKIIQKLKITLLRFFQGMIKPNVEYKGFSLINKILIFVTHVMGSIVPYNTKLKQYKYICEHLFNGKKQFIHRANDAYLGIGYIFDSEYMSDYTDIEFEHCQFMVNKRYHEFLERNYGPDYMTPPPQAERRPEHEIIRKDLL